ncbi:MAG TPA: hypothetical protein VNT01_08565 [Symbiobacteriaceae bacterium]|nr:hypothetical protein [Symbiobacteriaceae bacterium]
MLLKRVGLPVLVMVVTVLLTVAAVRWPSGLVAFAAPISHVTLSEPLQVPVTITDIAPGDSGSAGALRIRYDGNVPAWLGLDADLVGTLAEGDQSLTITVSDGTTRYQPRAMNQVLGLFSPGQQFSLAVGYAFPRQAGNAYQAKSASLILQIHAVAAEQNTRYENGRALGPITWSGGLGSVSALTGILTDPSAPPDITPCVGEGCAPAVAEQPVFSPVAGVTPPAAAAATLDAACCDCLRSFLWWWFLYAILLVLAMLASFYAGWRLRERTGRRRLHIKRRPPPSPGDPAPRP